MSFGIDANLLIYAAQADSPWHVRASEFLHRCAEGGEVFVLPWPVLAAFVRVVTHPGIFAQPLRMERALEDVESLIRLPHARALGEEEGFWEAFRGSCTGTGVRGRLVSDAHVAAILRSHGVRVIYSSDADFRRFDFLDVRNPLRD
jgi:uncharacterized protein